MFCQPTDPTDSHGLRRDPATARHPGAARPVRERGRRDRLLLRVDQEPVAHPLRRLDRRLDEGRGERIVSALEQMTGRSADAALRAELVTGADEMALVGSGLNDTMRQA